MAAFKIKIYGKVQAVGFRFFLRKKAEELKVRGYVKNNADGSIELYAIGEEESINHFLEHCKKGSANADVKLIEVELTDPINFKDFEIRK